MSLSTFLDMPEVTAKIKPFRPKLPRKITAPLRARPRSNNHAILGTAIDYLLRFELKRQAPHAVTERWVAECAPEMIWRKTAKGAGGWVMFKESDPEFYTPPEEIANRARKIVQDSKNAVTAYLKNEAPTLSQRAELAAYAIRLAKLDSVFRARRLDPKFEEVNQEDVDDLLVMLTIAPFEKLIHPQVMLLNPNFGETSLLVGGADTDLITGDMLVDFKTTNRTEMRVRDLDQLFGYYLLARNRQRSEPTFPIVNRLALYFCRHGFLWVQNATTWAEHPQFTELEDWFFRRAKEVFGSKLGDSPIR